MAYTKYSLTPANNTAAPPDGAPEGMLPSAVNDTMRDMMAQIRDVGDGVRDGTYTMTAPKITGGTITGVTLTGNTLTNPVITGATLTTSAFNGTVGATTASTGAFTTLSTSSTTTLSGLTASTALALDASKNVVSVTNTGTGNNVLSASPTLTGTIAGASLSLSSLTSGRVTYAGASGLLSDSANLTTDGTNLSLGAATSNYRLNIKGGGSIGDSSVYAQFTTLDTGSTSGDGLIIGLGVGSSPIAYIQQLENAPLAFSVNGSERMRITSAGNVGIGTSSPNAKLQVTSSSFPVLKVADAIGGGALALGDEGTNNNYVGVWRGAANSISGGGFLNVQGNGIAFMSSDNVFGSASERMRIDSSGNVGIGVTNPTQILQLGNATAVEFDSLIAGTRTSTFYTDNSQFIIETATNINMIFKTNATQRMVIAGGGNVGIGTSSPLQRLDVSSSANEGANVALTKTNSGTADQNGQVLFFNNSHPAGTGRTAGVKCGQLVWQFSQPSSGALQFAGEIAVLAESQGGASTASSLNFYSSGGRGITIDSGTIVSMPAYGAGTATFSAAGVISSVSDETWKTKDGIPTNTDAMLQKLEPGYWFYNEEKAPIFGADRQLGFYAQNVHEAIGEEAAPTPEEGKPWGYYDRSVLAVTVMSLKNALNTIEELKQRIETLENK